MNIKQKKEKIVLKHVNDFYNILENKLIERAHYFCNDLLLKTAEREYKLNDKLVSQEEFFKDLDGTDKYYFRDGEYMSKGLNVYKQRYRYTLTPQQAIEHFITTLDEDEQFIMRGISPKKVFIRSTWYGQTEMPNLEWHQGDDWEN